MAGVSKDGKGYRVQFMFNGKRRRLRLKGHNERQAEAVWRHIKALVLHKVSGQMVDGAAAQWVSDIDDQLYEKLRDFGLVSRRDVPVSAERLSEFVERVVIKARTNDGKKATPLTLKKWRTTANYLVECCGPSVGMDNFTVADAMDFRAWLEDKDGIESENTVRKHCQVAKMFFNAAIDAEQIARNPFKRIPTTSIENKARDYFVTRDEFGKCLSKCPDLDWKVILHLCRIGGMRCPSELLRATWDDVQWSNHRMLIHATKTEGHEGRETRLIPLWPELEAILKEAWNASPAGENRIITRYTDSAANLRTLFKKIIKRAGLKPWPKLFQNLRASRENELIDQGVPAHVAAAWIGHSVKVQRKSYLQVSDHHYASALAEAGGSKVGHRT